MQTWVQCTLDLTNVHTGLTFLLNYRGSKPGSRETFSFENNIKHCPDCSIWRLYWSLTWFIHVWPVASFLKNHKSNLDLKYVKDNHCKVNQFLSRFFFQKSIPVPKAQKVYFDYSCLYITYDHVYSSHIWHAVLKHEKTTKQQWFPWSSVNISASILIIDFQKMHPAWTTHSRHVNFVEQKLELLGT